MTDLILHTRHRNTGPIWNSNVSDYLIVCKRRTTFESTQYQKKVDSPTESYDLDRQLANFVVIKQSLTDKAL